MAIVILVSFLTLPLLEITLFVLVGDILGLGLTIGLVVLATLVGVWLLRYLGFTAFKRLQEGLARQEYPEVELFNAVCLFASALLLIVPGFFTDGLGLLFFLPGLRNLLRRIIFDHLTSSGVVFARGEAPFSHAGKGTPGEDYPVWQRGDEESHVIEGEFEDLTSDRKGSAPGSLSLPEDRRRDEGGNGEGKESEKAASGNGAASSS